MAKEDYLQGYGQGLKRGKENPITGPINKALDKALGNPHESARRGLDQGYDEMKKAEKLEEKRRQMKVLPTQLIDNPVSLKKPSDRTAEENAIMSEYEKPAPYKKGGKVKAKCMASGGKVSQLAKANGIAVRGKSRGKIC